MGASHVTHMLSFIFVMAYIWMRHVTYAGAHKISPQIAYTWMSHEWVTSFMSHMNESWMSHVFYVHEWVMDESRHSCHTHTHSDDSCHTHTHSDDSCHTHSHSVELCHTHSHIYDSRHTHSHPIIQLTRCVVHVVCVVIAHIQQHIQVTSHA